MAVVALGAAAVTVETSIIDYASANGWANGTQYSTITMDNYITLEAVGGGNTGKYYTSGTNWRFYQNEQASLKITASNGASLQSVTITYSVSNTGTLVNAASGTAVAVSGTSAEFAVGNTGTATNGQVRITYVSVTYVAGEAVVDAPTISVSGAKNSAGAFTGDATVTFTHADANATFNYTLDGTDPTLNSPSGSSVTVAKQAEDVVVSAIATVNGKSSGVARATIKFGEAEVDVEGTEDEITGADIVADKAAAYVETANITKNSGAVYFANAAKTSDGYVQLRSTNNNSGIVTTTSGGKIAKVAVEWGANTASGRVISVYGKTSAYADATELYDSEKQGELLGEITNGTSNELVISGDYPYVGVRSKNGALYANFTFTWQGASGIANPVITPASQDFEQDLTVTITSEAGTTIRYTVDGSAPTANSTVYSAPIVVSGKTTTVKAIAIDGNGNQSGIASATYTYTGTETVTLDYIENFKTDGLGKFKIENVTLPEGLSYVWSHDSRYGAKASAYTNNTANASESRLVSPIIDMTGAKAPTLTFNHALNKFAAVENFATEATLQVKEVGGEWQNVAITYPASQSWTFEKCEVDLSAYKGKKVQLAFHYISTSASAGTWEISDFAVTDGELVITYTDATIAESNAWTSDKDNVNLQLTNAQVVYAAGNYICIREGSEATALYQTGLALNVNEVLNGDIKLNFARYHQMPEFKAIENVTNLDGLQISKSEAEAQPLETTVAEIAALKHKWDLVKIKGVQIELQGNNYVIGVDNDTIQVFDKQATGLLEGIDAEKTYDIVAVFGDYYNNRAQLFPVSITEASTVMIGDVNGDGEVNVSDVVALANFAMGETTEGFNKEAADLNNDGEVNVSDVVALANQVMGN